MENTQIGNRLFAIHNSSHSSSDHACCTSSTFWFAAAATFRPFTWFWTVLGLSGSCFLNMMLWMRAIVLRIIMRWMRIYLTWLVFLLWEWWCRVIWMAHFWVKCEPNLSRHERKAEVAIQNFALNFDRAQIDCFSDNLLGHLYALLQIKKKSNNLNMWLFLKGDRLYY